MTSRETENYTLNFKKPDERGSVQETFFPWHLTYERFIKEGVPEGLMNFDENYPYPEEERYMKVNCGSGLIKYDRYFGFDGIWRTFFNLPFCYVEPEYESVLPRKVTCGEDWEKLKEYSEGVLEKHFTDELISNIYTPLKAGHDAGEYSVRMNIEGFFWIPRELFGIEEHLFAFYDYPELMHDICRYALECYLKYLPKILDIIPCDVLYISEDLSGKTGPMISGDMFDEFVGAYYKKLIPVLKRHGVGNVFVDTDGDFRQLIPNFIDAGVDGFLPMDVNAGMDIVQVRREFPSLKFIGGFNKLCIAEGKEAVDREFERILPIVRQGGFIPGTDHQVAPSTPLENYRYYIKRLGEIMKECGKDIK